MAPTSSDVRSTGAGGPLDLAARVVSNLADYGIVVAALETLGVLRRRRSVPRALLRLGVVGISIFFLNTVLKRLFDRPRPDEAAAASGLVRIPSSASFPSGHTMAAAASAVALPESAGGVGLSLAGAGLVGWSRLRLGAHHRGDVVGGFLIGAALGLACRRVLCSLVRE